MVIVSPGCGCRSPMRRASPIWRAADWRSLLSRPLVESDLPEQGVRAGDQGPLAQPHPVVGRLLVGDDLARVALGRKSLAHQLVEPELLRAADLLDSVRWLTHRDAAECRGDVVARSRWPRANRSA